MTNRYIVVPSGGTSAEEVRCERLHEAIFELVQSLGAFAISDVEFSCSPLCGRYSHPCWLTVTGRHLYEGHWRTMTFHVYGVTRSSRNRVLRLVARRLGVNLSGGVETGRVSSREPRLPVNREGMTWNEWCYAARWTDQAESVERNSALEKAWRNGEDPSEWVNLS